MMQAILKQLIEEPCLLFCGSLFQTAGSWYGVGQITFFFGGGGGGGYFKQLAGRNRNLEDVVIILRTRACCTYSVIVNWWERVYGLLTQSK